jgi:hypothetical protein
MKRFALIALTVLLALSLFACGNNDEDSNSIDDYVAPNYTHKIDTGTLTFENGPAETAIISAYTGLSTSHKVVIPNIIGEGELEVSGIGDEAFYYKTSVTEFVIPETVTFIGKFAFAGCTSIESIVIPASVTYIDDYAFTGCTSLKSVVFKGKELVSIGDFAFNGCVALEDIDLPEGLESIGNQAFGNCASLTSVAAPSTLKSIGNLAFYGCEGLNAQDALSLTASITEIGEYAFKGIKKAFINVPEGTYAGEYVANMTDDEEETEVDSTETESGVEVNTDGDAE